MYLIALQIDIFDLLTSHEYLFFFKNRFFYRGQISIFSRSRMRISSSMISRPWLPMNIITIYDNRLDYFHTNQGRLIIELWTREAGKSNPKISCDNTGPFGPSLYDSRIKAWPAMLVRLRCSVWIESWNWWLFLIVSGCCQAVVIMCDVWPRVWPVVLDNVTTACD